MELVLNASGLVKKFGNLVAVDNLTLELAAGRCLALLGPNGAGKTTTVEILEGLKEADEGQVRIFGRLLREHRREIYERIGAVLQETNLYKRYTVTETFELFASFYERNVGIAELINQLGLTEKKDIRLGKLSGGQKQRVYLGCALVNDPDLLFLDEPTTGLDPQARRHLWEMLLGFKKRGKTILLTTHYMDEAEVLADEVAIIDHGKIIAKNSPRALIKTHCGDQVVWFKPQSSQPMQVEKFLAQISEGTNLATPKDEGFEISTADAAGFVTRLMGAARSANVELNALEMRRATLEDVFIKLTGRSLRDA